MIKLYTIHCPSCEILQSKLDKKKIPYKIIDDREELRVLGIDLTPVLDIDGQRLDFGAAIQWVNKQGG